MKWTLGLIVFLSAAFCGAQEAAEAERPSLPPDLLAAAEQVWGLEFSASERTLLAGSAAQQRVHLQTLRRHTPDNAEPPALVFVPTAFEPPRHLDPTPPRWSKPGAVKRPQQLADLAFAPVGVLAELVRSRQVTSRELTVMYLDRLKKHGDQLEAVITLTEERALAAAERADREIATGLYRGPLHGIPYGAKDLFAVAGYPTTWGAKPFAAQVLDETATVVEKLDAAGAVLVAKLSLGALAWGDVWHDGFTRNPWNLEQGSSGSSAGSAAAVAAGLVPFALGTETWGSIVSPATRCGVTGLRPSFGAVSRAGAMALSWSMDKVGPITRTVEDSALVFEVIRGVDRRDPSTVATGFAYHADEPVKGKKIGYVPAHFEGDQPGRDLDRAALERLKKLGVELVPMTLPDLPVQAMSIILSVEAAAAFEELTLSGRDDEMVRQIEMAWPNVFRAARLIPAVEYLQANRLRGRLIAEMNQRLQDLDGYITPSFAGNNLLLTNLTGHPCVVVPNGFINPKQPYSFTFTGKLHDDAGILRIAKAWQDAGTDHQQHPPQFLPAASP
ncbi:amidase [Acanthopleuribacter pedis]|uniref:Amidase n=1 Tax=Acanthopleuribacter pedis TaxID=442870 RepID=A0A8J7Q870_9BACT|nr:amidase [Acanthopleuribacter pedis]MBO1320236.1 amidase [Acanthopleuribacter pedis]